MQALDYDRNVAELRFVRLMLAPFHVKLRGIKECLNHVEAGSIYEC